MWTPGNGGTADAAAFARATAQTVEEAVILGDRESVVGLVEKELEAGADPFELVRGRLIPAITEVGSKYERREYFLPQLLRSAETMADGFRTPEAAVGTRSQCRSAENHRCRHR